MCIRGALCGTVRGALVRLVFTVLMARGRKLFNFHMIDVGHGNTHRDT